MNRNTSLAALAVVSAITLSGAYAATKSAENDALAVSSANISLTQAVAAAEQHVGGKAAKAEYERHKGQWVFDIEVVKDKQVMERDGRCGERSGPGRRRGQGRWG